MSATPNQVPSTTSPIGNAGPKRKPSPAGVSVAFVNSISGGLSTIVSKDGPKGSIDILRLAVHSALQAQLTRMAAALTYRTIFSLIPIMVIGVAILGAFSTEDQVRQSITRVLQFGGLAIDAAVVTPESTTPDAGKGIEQWILELVGRVRGVSYSGVAIIGILTLIYGAISMLIEIEMAFNQVYHAPAGRSWSRRITQYWTLLTLGPVLLFASFAVGERFQALVSNMSVRAAENTSVQQFMVGFAGYSATVAISTLMLWVIYVTVPNTKVRMRAAVVGAVIAAILWELGKWGFRAYVASGSVKQLYGALFLLPLFMLWIYVTWMIVLAGLQLSFSLQMFWEVREEGDSFWKRFLSPPPSGPLLVDGGLALGLPLMVVLARRFRDGKPAHAGELAGEFALSEPVTLDVLQRFASAGLLHRVATGDESERAFVLSRPPEAITGEEIVTAGDPMWEGADRSPHASLLKSARDARLVGVKGKSLAELAG